MPKPRAALLPLILALALSAPCALSAADLRVDQLELLTHGGYSDSSGAFEASSRLFFDLALEGGDKFSGLLKMSLLNSDIESSLALAGQDASAANYLDKIDALLAPSFRTVAVTSHSPFALPLDLCYFVGSMDSFCSGDDFVTLFGAAPFATELRGPIVYPEGIGGDNAVWYDGIHAASGTGFRLSTTARLSASSAAYAYFYQDSYLGSGNWSGDLRYLVNGPALKAEFFAGATTGGDWGIYRGGLLFYATAGEVGEFFAQAGVTRWEAGTAISLDNLYFLFEPRVNFSFGQVSITVFSHPSWYLQKDYSDLGERGALDAAFNLRFGRIAQSGMQGGLETLFAFRPDTADATTTPPLAIDLSPYYALIASGVRWDFKLDLRLFPFPEAWYGMFRPFIGLKTSY
jgi:hypothetical protein